MFTLLENNKCMNRISMDQAIELGWSFNMHPNRPVLCRPCSQAEREVLADERVDWIARGKPLGMN